MSTPTSRPAASKPISINNISSDEIYGSQHSPWSISSDDDERRYGGSALSAALRNSDSFGDSTTVGSLPVNIRRPGRGGGHHRHLPNNHSRKFAGSVSLPQPRAPFLSSREEPKDKLSSMPEVTLPESVMSKNMKLFSSVQFSPLHKSSFPDQYHLRARKSNDAEVTAKSLKPLSFPIYSANGCIEDHFNPNKFPTNSLLGGSVIGLPEQESSASSHVISDVEGITEGCTEITLNEKDGTTDNESMQGDAVSCIVGNPVDLNKGIHDKRFELDVLSSSLTALDVLTQIKESQMTLNEIPNIDHLKNTASVGKGTPQHNGAQQLQTRCTLSPEPLVGECGYGNDDQHANPDTFEAFDFEFDG